MIGAHAIKLASLLGAMAGLTVTADASAFSLRDSNDITAVCGRTSSDYVRSRQADGSFAPESYAFGKGGVLGGSDEG